MKMMNRLSAALLGVLGALAAMGDVAPVSAADIEWRTHLVWVPTRQEAQAVTTLAERINARTGDKFQMTVFPGGSLGIKDPDMLRILPPGNVIQATMISTNYVARDSPELAYALPEGVLQTMEDFATIRPTLEQVYAKEFEKFGIKVLNILLPPDRTMDVFCKMPVNTLEELRTKKLRVWGAFLVDAFAEVGVSATVIPQNDMYMALQTGVVDCATYYPGPANTLSLQEVTPYWSNIANYAATLVFIVSQSAWDKLPADVQTIITEESDKLAKELIANFLRGDYDKAQGDKFNAAGGKQLDPFPAEDREAFYQAALSIWERDATQKGGDMATNRETLLQALQD